MKKEKTVIDTTIEPAIRAAIDKQAATQPSDVPKKFVDANDFFRTTPLHKFEQESGRRHLVQEAQERLIDFFHDSPTWIKATLLETFLLAFYQIISEAQRSPKLQNMPSQLNYMKLGELGRLMYQSSLAE